MKNCISDRKDEHGSLRFIAYDTLDSLLSRFSSRHDQQISQLFYNYNQIISIIRSIINGTHQGILPQSLNSSLLQQYSPSALIYAIIIKAFQYSPTLVNHAQTETHKYFLTLHPSEPATLLQTFVNILQEKFITDKLYTLQLLDRIEQKINLSIKKARKDPANLTITQDTNEELLTYKCRITVGDSSQVLCEEGDLIFLRSSTYLDKKGEKQLFYQEFYDSMKQHFGSKAATSIIEETQFVVAAITYLETAKLMPAKTNTTLSPNNFTMEMPFYSQLADTDNFSIAIRFIEHQTATKQTTFQLKITINSPNITTISISEYQHRQNALANALKTKLITVQNLIYQIDSSNKLGKGTYGSVFQCQCLQLLDQTITPNERIYCFKRKTMAAKQLTLTPEEHRRLIVPANRQHLILTFISELRHRQAIKDIQRQLGYQVERNLVGIEHIIPMVDYFKINAKSTQEGKRTREEEYYLIFELARTPLHNKNFLNKFTQNNSYNCQLFSLFYKIFQALTCLHFEINQLYPHELIRYFALQNSDDNNHEKDDSISFPGKNGIIHRDIKPSNIMVNHNEQYQVTEVFLIDLGMAKISDLKTKSDTNCGSSYFMSPEVRNGLPQNETIDVWGAAVILFEMYAKNQTKLYPSVEIHSMNSINREIDVHIIALMRDGDQKWEELLKQTLTTKIQPQNAKAQIRKNSKEIINFMTEQASHLKRISLSQQYTQFSLADYYICKSNTLKELSIQINAKASIFQNRPTEQLNFQVSTLRQYLKNSYNKEDTLQMVLVCLYHAQLKHTHYNLPDLRLYLSTLHILSFKSSNANARHYAIKEGEPAHSIEDHAPNVLKDMQQTIALAQLKRGEQKIDEFVVLDTDAIIKQFKPSSKTFSSNSVHYFNGFKFDSSGKMDSRIYSIDEGNPIQQPFDVTQQKSSNKLFIMSTRLPHHYDLLLNATEQSMMNLSTGDLLRLGTELAKVVEAAKRQETRVIFEQLDEDGAVRQNFTHLLRLKYSQHHLSIKINSTTLAKILTTPNAFQAQIKDLLLNFIQPNADFAFPFKINLCLYLKSSSLRQYNQLSSEFRQYRVPSRLLTDLQQLLAWTCYLEAFLKTKIKKRLNSTIQKLITKLKENYQHYFIATSPQLPPSTTPAQLNTLKEYFKSLPEEFNHASDLSQKMVFAAYLGSSVAESMLLLRPFLRNRSTANTDI